MRMFTMSCSRELISGRTGSPDHDDFVFCSEFAVALQHAWEQVFNALRMIITPIMAQLGTGVSEGRRTMGVEAGELAEFELTA